MREKRSTLKAEDWIGQQEDLLAHRGSRHVGLQQYFTPEPVAEALLDGITVQGLAIDPTCGRGSLLAPINATIKAGVDIDAQAVKQLPGDVHGVVADLPRLLPYLNAVGFKPDYVVLNPPYGLRWDSRWGARDAQEVCLRQALTEWRAHGCGIFSRSTYERLLDEHLDEYSQVRSRIEWAFVLRNVWPGTDVEVVAFYFTPFTSNPMWLPRDGYDCSTPEGIQALREDVRRLQQNVITRYVFSYSDTEDMLKRLQAAHQRYARDLRGEEQKHNLELKGRNLHLRLDGYARYSLLKKLDRASAQAIFDRIGSTPISYFRLYPKARRELLAVLKEGLITASEAARRALEEAQQPIDEDTAPFREPKPQQRLAYLENFDTIRCTRSIGPFAAGQEYPIAVQTQINTQEFTKTRVRNGDLVNVEYVRVTKGLEILIWPDAEREGEPIAFSESKEDIERLTQHFELPTVKRLQDISRRFQENLRRLEELGL